ncbi:NADP-dependent oxidoreductase [Aeromicrobium sp. A1-2]|uniref:NADP-dependent oxidoreductase n=1 Tax=Aeromicrobium sp. A1-2 TaxID=2107713 RepID=UPI000E54C0C4|nr:NADP-dependent oxidoreductase [Aeromicrobium sp. A1-2]AXT84377.1 NADP-dependent oxidoreductase [Aeromicrobium sp. A1-2]
MTTTAQQVLLKQRPVGLTDEQTWEYVSTELPALEDGEFLIKVDYLSMDPAMRGWLNDVRSYVPPVQIGAVMRAFGIGTVTESRHEQFAVGETVMGIFGATDHVISTGKDVTRADLAVAAAPTWLGTLGMPGMTAYFGLLEVGKVTSGDTVVVSGAAGAVGSVVGQIAKAKGATVIGIAGGPQKCQWLTETLGFDAAIDYKNESVSRRLREIAPTGINVFFDNVGGEILDAALANLTLGARVVICGGISAYNESKLPPGPSRYMSLLVFRATMTGFLVFDFEDRYPEAVTQMSSWLEDGTLIPREQVVEGGIAAFGDALQLLFTGGNTGKLVLRV